MAMQYECNPVSTCQSRTLREVRSSSEKEEMKESDTSAEYEVCSAEKSQQNRYNATCGGEDVEGVKEEKMRGQKTRKWIVERGSRSQLESGYWTPPSLIGDEAFNSIIFKSNMPQLLRNKENSSVPPQVIKVTLDQMKALFRQGRMGQLIPATMTFTDSGEQIIRPALLPLNH